MVHDEALVNSQSHPADWRQNELTVGLLEFVVRRPQQAV